ncbi:hypothetical protein K2X05_07240 [bacterium]|nr:hypothetical protein [bacterium]
MIKISVFVEDKSGKVLGEAHSQREKIIIGSAEDCSLKINDNKVSPIESEVYSVSGECWIQVGKEGAPVTYQNKQYRTLKIEKNSELQFRNYKLKVMIEPIAEKQAEVGYDLGGESTKIVNEPTKLVLDDATRIVKKEEEKSAEATRIVVNSEATRIVEVNEATRVVEISEATRIVNLEKEETLAKFNFDENKTRIISQNESTKKMPTSIDEESDFFFNNSTKSNHFSKIGIPPELIKYMDTHLKEVVFFAFASLICLYIGKTILFGSKSKKTNLEQIAESQIQQLQKDLTIRNNNSDADKLKHVEKTVQAVSKEVYLRELSSLFDKN